MMSVFAKYLLRIPERDPRSAAAAIRAGVGDSIWGVWAGLFGIANNELIVMTVGAAERPVVWPEGFVELASEPLRATARPRSTEPLTREGLYVFRSFELDAAHIERVVELSDLAWRTFEASDEYLASPVGLFAPLEPDPACTMWLLTWYDGLGSWQTSRAPHPEAAEYFRQRHALIDASTAVATRLLV